MSSMVVEERFGPYGGRYVPEVLIPALDELASAWGEARADPAFREELDALLRGHDSQRDSGDPRWPRNRRSP